MLLDRLKNFVSNQELSRIAAEAKSRRRRVSASVISPFCLALERAAMDGDFPKSHEKVPRRILQFWDQKTIPPDVQNCMASWRSIPDFDHVLFDEEQAREFIRTEYDARHLDAYDLCNHPAMKADLFRLAYLYRHGGVYIDADDSYQGSNLEQLFREDGLFRARTASFRRNLSEPPVTVYNNNPIFCVPNDKIIRMALQRAVGIMLSMGKSDFYNVVVITGPVNLSIAAYMTALDCIARDEEFLFCPIIGWDDIARKSENLEFQKTERNWRVAQQIHRDAKQKV